MNRDEYRAFLLRNMQGASVQSGGDEVVCKCKYCADKMDHYHMYISVPMTESELSYFNCFICHSSGVVTAKRFMEWGIFDSNMNEEITRHNAIAAHMNPMAYKDMSSGIYRTLINNLNNPHNQMKLKYLNDRLGLNLSIEEATQNNVVLNLIDLLNYNRITELTRDPRVVKSLSDNFIGFLSADGNFVNLRCIGDYKQLHPSIAKKYINYNIHGKKDTTMKFISIPTYVNSIDTVQIHMAEGPFDIFSVKYNLRGVDSPNSIFYAVTGNAYKGLIKHLITDLGFISMELHLYLDNDEAGMYTLSDILRELYVFPQYKVYLHLNTAYKDMGVPINMISETIQEVK